MIFFIALLLVCGTWFGIAAYLHNHPRSRDDYSGGMAAATFVFVIGLIILIGFNISLFINQVSDFTKADVIDEKIELLQTRSDNISNSLKEVLVDKYSEHETEIFSEMTGDDITILLVKYPELRASETFINYTDKLFKLENDVYNLKQEKINIVQRTSFRLRHPLNIITPKN